MYTLLVVLAFAAPPPETEIYFPSSIWHQRVELNAGERVTLVGHSAGAYSAAVLALDPANQGRIKKVKLMSGVYEVGPCVRLLTVGRWSKPPRPFRGMSKWDASPLFNIPPANKDSPVFDLYYATHDLPGSRRQSERFYTALIGNGYTATLTEVPARHGTIPFKLGY